MSAPRCSDCRFFHADGARTLNGAPIGECRRHSPTPAQFMSRMAVWPTVSVTAWCGEFRPASDPTLQQSIDWLSQQIAEIGVHIRERG